VDDFTRKSNRFRFYVLLAIDRGFNDTISISEAIARNTDNPGSEGNRLRRVNDAIRWLLQREYIFSLKDPNDVLYFFMTKKFTKKFKSKKYWKKGLKSVLASFHGILGEIDRLKLMEHGYEQGIMPSVTETPRLYRVLKDWDYNGFVYRAGFELSVIHLDLTNHIDKGFLKRINESEAREECRYLLSPGNKRRSPKTKDEGSESLPKVLIPLRDLWRYHKD